MSKKKAKKKIKQAEARLSKELREFIDSAIVPALVAAFLKEADEAKEMKSGRKPKK